MAKGNLISKGYGTEYEIEFNLTTSANLEKEPVTATVATGKRAQQLTRTSLPRWGN